MRRFVPLALAVALACPLPARATPASALIARALDSQQDLDLDAVLPDAMQQIASATGVRLEADPAVWDLLPWGEQTNITAKLRNLTLRNDLTAVTHKLGLTFEQTDDAVLLKPLPALRRLGRRATVGELGVLDLMGSTPINLPTDRPTVRDVVAAVDGRLRDVHSPFAVEDRASDSVLGRRVGVAPNATVLDALEAVAAQTPVTWYPWGQTLVVLPKEHQVRQQLQHTISTRYAGVDVAQVLLELSKRAGVPFDVDPGAYQRVPAAYRNVSLLLDNATVQSALESIGGYTGLGFDVTADGVHVYNQFTPTAEAPPTTGPTTRP
jgi:hypothetical protein